jgi:hypothetical protein
MADPPKKRVSLPVVGEGSKKTLLDQAELGDDEAGTRGVWSWVFLGVMAVFVVLVPLAMLAMAVLKRAYATSDSPPVAPLVVVSIAAIGSSCFLGGWLVGRFGPRMTARLGAATGVLTGLVLWALTRTLLGGVIVVVTAPFTALGAHVGRRGRRGGPKPDGMR